MDIGATKHASFGPASEPTCQSQSLSHEKQDQQRAKKETNNKRTSYLQTGQHGSTSASTSCDDGGAGISKPKQTKSRNGCSTCKAKRLKCDETKPSCLQCGKRKVVCGGYKKEFKWRSSNEVTFEHKPGANPAKPDRPKVSGPLEHQFSVSDHTSTTGQETQSAPQPPNGRKSNSPPSASTTLPLHTASAPEPASAQPFQPPFGVLPIPSPQPQSQPFPPLAFPNVPQAQQSFPADFSADVQNHDYRPRMPSISDLLAQDNELDDQLPELHIPYSTNGLDLNGSNVSFQIPQTFPNGNEDHGEAEDIIRNEHFPQYKFHRRGQNLPRNFNDTSACDQLSLAISPESPLFKRPQFEMCSWEMLFSAFDRNTCGIMSIRNGFKENPWKELIAPLIKESPALRYAVGAMSAFHASIDIPSFQRQGVAYMAASSQALVQSRNEKPEVILACTLAMAFADSWDWGEMQARTGLDYIKVARTLVPQVLHNMRNRPYSKQELDRMSFLCKTWIYIDVLARLTSIDEDASDECNEVSLQLAGPSNIETKIDPLMGSASTLFPIIGRVANLIRRVCKTNVNTPEIINVAMDLRSMLMEWDAPAPFEMPMGDQHELVNSLHTAEAYRWSTLLYLHQAVPEIPSPDSEFMAREVIQHLDSVSMDSNIVIVQIYPLFAAGCEANDPEMRAWVQDRLDAMKVRMRIGNIHNCNLVVKEVWRRRDEYNAMLASQPFHRSQSMPEDFGGRAGVNDALNDNGDFGFNGIRRATFPEDAMSSEQPNLRSFRRQSVDLDTGGIDHEFTVRGSLHWVSVMKDNQWEILLG